MSCGEFKYAVVSLRSFKSTEIYVRVSMVKQGYFIFLNLAKNPIGHTVPRSLCSFLSPAWPNWRLLIYVFIRGIVLHLCIISCGKLPHGPGPVVAVVIEVEKRHGINLSSPGGQHHFSAARVVSWSSWSLSVQQHSREIMPPPQPSWYFFRLARWGLTIERLISGESWNLRSE